MNLERLFIENYKQLREPVELFPPEGAIGVVGANGTGKSTLFESILWAFFGSKGAGPRFANESIPWSGGSAKDPTTVEVTLATPGGSYTVRRRLKGNATTAEAVDGSGKSIVTGAADVTRWAEENLLRMDRTAFEATFYARQKELRFFAHDDGISRVRRVSKLLGISGVETAQGLLRADRNTLRAEARLLEGRLAEADEDTLRGELEEARSACRRLEVDLEKIDGDRETAEEVLKAAREARGTLEAAYRKHTRLVGELREAEGKRDRDSDRVAEAKADLADLAAAEEEMGRLRPDIDRMPEVAAALDRLEQNRQKSERRERDRRESLLARKRISAIESEASDALDELDSEGEEPLPGWDALFDLEGAELLKVAVEVLGRANGALREAEAGYEELKEIEARHEAYRGTKEAEHEADELHRQAKEEAEKLAEESEDLSAGEDLEGRERELRREEDKLREVAATHRGRANADEREARNVDKAREAIAGGLEDHCPTCHRPFESGEQDDISDTLKRQAAAIRRRAAREIEEAEGLSAAADAAAERLEKVSARLDRWRGLRETFLRAQDRASDRLVTLERARGQREELEASIAGTDTPTAQDLQEVRSRSERLRALRDARPKLESLASEHSRLAGRVEELAEGLDELADVSYDPESHRALREEAARLERARGRIEELERRLATRPEIEKAMQEAAARVEEAGARAGELRGEISALGFDEAGYEAANERVAEAEERVATLRDARERLGGEWKDADHRIERASAEIGRLEAERKLANQKAAAASRMDEMDGLFTEFFKGLTARARPMLEAEASAMVRELTDGRYERMEFDENFRVRLLDRFDDSYAIERFSGGEADVASLSARVALSKIIAARGGGTLGFLVLDEVFGSLDASRRNNVLLALERLKRFFGQIFVISHVGEVQESALVDEVWMLEEDEEGKSTISIARPASPNVAALGSVL
jgi:DNA repair protein SbcC/Rad50